jgi:putative phosphoesterase
VFGHQTILLLEYRGEWFDVLSFMLFNACGCILKLNIMNPIYTIGVVADTHVPDRLSNLHPGLFPALRESKIDVLFHAGDICIQKVITELNQVAPVVAVRGNRDLLLGKLPLSITQEIGGITVAMTHGHWGWGKYLWDKWRYFFKGYNPERYFPLMAGSFPQAQVVIFGHTHYPENQWIKNQLVFNPGSIGIGMGKKFPPSFGLLRIYPGGRVDGEIIGLKGAKITNRKWVY